MTALKQLGVAMENEKLLALVNVARRLNLLTGNEEALFEAAKACARPSLRVHCEDQTDDLCSSGHLPLAALAAAPLLLPGILLAVSEIVRERGARFRGGDALGGRSCGHDLGRRLRWFLMPLYVVVMAPASVGVTIFR